MKKNLATFLCFIFLFSNANSQNDLSADDIWNKYFSAIGKQENIDKIKTAVKTSVMVSDMGIVTNITQIIMPNKMHSKVNMGDNNIETTILNNGIAVRISEKGVEELIGYDLISAIIETRFIDKNVLYDMGYLLSKLEDSMLNDKEYYRIKWENKEYKESLIYYIDKEEYTFSRIEREIDGREYEFIIKKTIVIDGINLFKEGTIFMNETEVELRMSYRFNTDIDKSLFKIKKHYKK